MGTILAERHTDVVTRQAELDGQADKVLIWTVQTGMRHQTFWLYLGNSDALKLAP